MKKNANFTRYAPYLAKKAKGGKRALSLLGIVILNILIGFSIFSQDNSTTNAQVLLEGMDKEIIYPEGTSLATFSIRKGNSILKEQAWYIYRNKQKTLLEGFSKPDEIYYRQLCIDKDEEIVYTKIPSKLLEKISLEDRYVVNPKLGFSYIDLCAFKYESNYITKAVTSIQIGENKYWNLEVSPLKKDGYSKLNIYLHKSDYRPYRIDFYDHKGILRRIGKFFYREIEFRNLDSSKEKRNRVAKYTMTDLERNYIYTIELNSVITDPNPVEMRFDQKNLGWTSK